jgi:metal-sulfur cluster biosynthetic enzyme
VKYPGFSRDIVSFGLVRTAGFFDGTVKVSLALTSSDPKTPLQLKPTSKTRSRLPGVKDILVEIAVAPAKNRRRVATARPRRQSRRQCRRAEKIRTPSRSRRAKEEWARARSPLISHVRWRKC